MICKDGQLAELVAKVEQWRLGKAYRGASMPETLWKEAAEVARSMGVGPVAHALKISPGKLKGMARGGIRGVEKNWRDTEQPSQLVEVAAINLDGFQKSDQMTPVAVLEHAGTTLSFYQTLGADDIAALIRAVSGGAR